VVTPFLLRFMNPCTEATAVALFEVVLAALARAGFLTLGFKVLAVADLANDFTLAGGLAEFASFSTASARLLRLVEKAISEFSMEFIFSSPRNGI
jgi:hypothetical protein